MAICTSSVGDGDPGVLQPPGVFAQRLDDLLGNILRIDPRGGDPYAVPPDNPFVGVTGVRPEIWAYGLRNPWRFWIDRPPDRCSSATSGAATRRRSTSIPRGAIGLNFGWPCFEGTLVLRVERRRVYDPFALSSRFLARTVFALSSEAWFHATRECRP